MSNGAHGDLFPVRYYKVDTPVNWVESNEPLQDLEANILILDGKLARIMAEGIATSGGGGGGGSPPTVSLSGTRTVVIDKLNTANLVDPTPGTLGTDLSTLDFADGANESQKFEFTVPADYVGGDLTIDVQYAVDGTSGGTVDFTVSGEIARNSGFISTFGPTVVPLAVSTSANAPDSLSFFTIAEGGFDSSDRVRVQFIRDGVGDSNTDTFKLLGFTVTYTGVIATGGTHTVQIDYTQGTDEPSPTPGVIGTGIASLDFDPSTDQETKISVIVPQEWDEVSDPILKITYAMSTSVASSFVRIGLEGEVADVVNGTVNTLTPQSIDVRVPDDTQFTTVQGIALPAASFTKGSVCVVKTARRNAVGSNHTGLWKVAGYEFIFNTPTSAVVTSVATIGATYLEQYSFGNQSGSVNADIDYPNFATDFETFYKMSSTAASGRVDVAFQGKIPSGFTTISSITTSLYGTGAGPDYVLKVYAEGSGSSPVYDPTAGSPIAAPGSSTPITIPSASLSTQPTGDGVFFVVVEAYIDASEVIYASRPYVTFA